MGLKGPDAAAEHRFQFTHFEDVPSCSTMRPQDKYAANIKPLMSTSGFMAYYKEFCPALVSFLTCLPFEWMRRAVVRVAISFLWRFSIHECRLGTLDDALKEHSLTPQSIDLLKVDVEGMELEVLKGIPDHWWPKIQQAVVEVHDLESRLQQISKLFAANDFKVKVYNDDFYNDEVGMNHHMLVATKL